MNPSELNNLSQDLPGPLEDSNTENNSVSDAIEIH